MSLPSCYGIGRLPNEKPIFGTPLNPFHQLNQGLVGCWAFNEQGGNKAFDLSGNGNHGTLIGATWTPSKFGGGLAFDGLNDYVNRDAVITGTPVTISAWVKTNDLNNERRIVTINDGGTSANVLSILIDSHTNKLQVQHYDTSGDGAFSTVAMSINTWHHVVGVFASDSSRIAYLDGVAGNPDTESQNAMTGLDTTDIGTLYWSGGRIQFWSGSIDSVRIYNRALSATEVKQLYRNHFGTFQQPCEAWLYAAAPPAGAIMNQFQKVNMGSDLYDGALVI